MSRNIKAFRYCGALCVSGSHKYCYVEMCECQCHFNMKRSFSGTSYDMFVSLVSELVMGPDLPRETVSEILEKGLRKFHKPYTVDELRVAVDYVTGNEYWSRELFDDSWNNTSIMKTDTLF